MNKFTRKACEKIRNNINTIESIITNIDYNNSKNENMKELLTFLKIDCVPNLRTIHYETCAKLEKEDDSNYEKYKTPTDIDTLVQKSSNFTQYIKDIVENNKFQFLNSVLYEYSRILDLAIEEKIIINKNNLKNNYKLEL